MATVLITLSLAGPALAFYLSPRATGLLSYRRGDIGDGEIWRLVTCHWTHWTVDHLRWDLLAFAVLVPLCWRLRPRRMIGALVASAVLIPAAVWLFIPNMVEYRGLSGLDSALFVLLGVLLVRDELAAGSKIYAAVFGLALFGFAGKVVFELLSASALFVASSEFVPVPLAHIVGGMCGLFFALWPESNQSTQLFPSPVQRESLQGTGVSPPPAPQQNRFAGFPP